VPLLSLEVTLRYLCTRGQLLDNIEAKPVFCGRCWSRYRAFESSNIFCKLAIRYRFHHRCDRNHAPHLCLPHSDLNLAIFATMLQAHMTIRFDRSAQSGLVQLPVANLTFCLQADVPSGLVAAIAFHHIRAQHCQIHGPCRLMRNLRRLGSRKIHQSSSMPSFRSDTSQPASSSARLPSASLSPQLVAGQIDVLQGAQVMPQT